MNDHQECPRLLRRRGKPKKAILCATFQISLRPTASSNGESQIKLTQINYVRSDGLTLLRRLRASGSALPLMLITGHGDIPMAVTAMKAGAIDFLGKPFEADTLLAAVAAASRHRLSDTNAEDAEAARRCLKKLTSREYEVFECDPNKSKIAALLEDENVQET